MENPGYEIDSKEFSTVTSASDCVTQTPIILYTRRWVLLAIFSLISMMNEVIWISLSSVSTIMTEYYRVSFHTVNWLAMIFSAVYFTVAIAVYILNRFGLKAAIVLGALCNTISAGFRLVGYRRHGFWYALVGNIVGGVGQSFLLFIPPTLSSVWFGDEERGRATSIGMTMNMLGVALGFLITTVTIVDDGSHDYDGAIKQSMLITMAWQAGVCVLILGCSIVFIQKEPPTPPTMSQALNIERRNIKHELRKQSKSETNLAKIDITIKTTPEGSPTQSTGFFKNLKSLMTNVQFHLMIQAYGFYYGLFNSMSTLFNQMAANKFAGHKYTKMIGMTGFASTLCGLAGIMLAGVWIDKTHRYKLISMAIFAGGAIASISLALVLNYSDCFILTAVCFCLVGFFQYPYLSVGLEYLAELMYPVKESYLSFISFFVGTLYGVIFVNALGAIIHSVGAVYAGYVITGIYSLGFLCVGLVKGELKRYNIDKARSESA